MGATGGQATPGSYFQGYYLAYLGRQGDPAGVAVWLGALQRGATDQQVLREYLAASNSITIVCDLVAP